MTTTRVSRRVGIGVALWILILVITGIFQIYRGALPDGLVFLVLAVALAADAAGAVPATRTITPPRVLTAIAVASTAAVLALTPRHGPADGVVLAISGILVLVLAWPEPTSPAPARWTSRLKRTARLWAVLGIAVCLWELTMYFLGAYLPGGRNQFPALSDLLDPILANPIARVLFVAAWLLGGVALARRGRQR